MGPAALDLVAERIDLWEGEDPGLGRQWVNDAIAPLAPADQAAVRLGLLTAMASYQVDDTVIDAFRAHRPDDASLVGVTAWASFRAVRRISTWLGNPTL